jgi:aryl-alcohol dehydrogenase-like predicted oxidoreductase
MQTTTLGRTGLQVSRLCLGTMTFDGTTTVEEAMQIMDMAFDAGIFFFDTADIYSRWIAGNHGGESETVIGRWLKTRPRREVVIATKVRGRMWPGVNGEGLSRHHILHAVEDSLRRLGTDYIDLYQTHWPDDQTPLEETLAALDALVQSGKVRYIGASNHSAWLLMKAIGVSQAHHLAPYATIQPNYSLFYRAEFERELAPMCIDQGLGVLPYSPLAAGFATGKYTRAAPLPDTTRGESTLIRQLMASDQAHDALDALREIARTHDTAPATVALAWLLAQPAVTAPIVGCRKPSQFAVLAAASELALDSEEIGRLTALTDGL